MSQRLPKEVRPIAVVVVIGALMSILDTTIVNVALETLRTDLHTSLRTIQWVATGYLLALAAVIPLTGWAAERFGTKTVWMTVVGGFVVTSALCAAAWSAESLIVFRVLQGFAGGMVMPIGMITLAQAAGPAAMGRTMGVVGVPMLMGPVLGPVIGGLIVTNLSWRWIFLVNVPIGAIGLLLAARLLPGGRPTRAPKLDFRGFAMLSPGVALIVFGLAQVSQHGGLGTASATVPLVAGIGLVTAFVFHALHHPRPLVDVRLFAHRGFAAAAATTTLVGAALFGALLLLPLYYQVARQVSPLEAGLLMAPQGLGAALGMNTAGRWTDRVGAGRVVLVGIALLVVGTIPFTQVGPHTSYVLLAFALVVRGLGLGATMMPAMAAAYATLERDQVPRATPMLNVLQRTGGSLGIAVLAVILQNQITSELGAAAGRGGADASRSLSPAARARIAEPLAHAFATTYWWALVVTAIAAIPAFILARTEAQARREARRAAAAQAPEPEFAGV